MPNQFLSNRLLSVEKSVETGFSTSWQLFYGTCTSLCGSLFLLIVGLIIFGAAIQAFEASNEINSNLDLEAQIDILIDFEVPNETIDFFLDLIEADIEKGIEGFSTFEDDDWTGQGIKAYSASVAYAFDLASTIGYGNIPAQTRGGRSISLLAIIILFPITVVAYTRLAEAIYNNIGNRIMSSNSKYKAVIKRYDNENIGELDVKELYLIFQDLGLQITNEECEVIIKQYDINDNAHLSEAEFKQLCVDLNLKIGLLARENIKLEISTILFIIYVIVFTFISRFVFLDNFFDAFYFVVVTVSTVGLGDVVPPQQYRAIFSILAFFGVGFMALLFKAIVDKLYDKTDLKKRYFHRALAPVFKQGRVVSFKRKDPIVPAEGNDKTTAAEDIEVEEEVA